MKRIVAVTTLATLLALPPLAEAASRKQRVEGSIQLAAPAPDGSGACFFGLHRRVSTASQNRAQGLVGFQFDVDRATAGTRFRLQPADESVNLDIAFYRSLGDIADPATIPPVVVFADHDSGGEVGVVPKGYPVAIVCMVSGGPTEFTYTAGR